MPELVGQPVSNAFVEANVNVGMVKIGKHGDIVFMLVCSPSTTSSLKLAAFSRFLSGVEITSFK